MACGAWWLLHDLAVDSPVCHLYYAIVYHGKIILKCSVRKSNIVDLIKVATEGSAL